MNFVNFKPNVASSTDNPRGGIQLTFDVDADKAILLSDSWLVAGWRIQFVQLGAHQTLILGNEKNYVKVILGRLENHGRGCYAEDIAVRSTRIDTPQVLSGADGVLFALMTETDEAPVNLHDMSECQFIGPSSDALNWASFEEKFGDFIDVFNGVDCHMANGFHLLDQQGTEIVYVNFWTCGKGVDLSTHNHAQTPTPMSPAFVEVHLVLNNGTGRGGMYETTSPGAVDRIRHTMLRGDEHGPYFEHANGKPVLLENGAVKYPWHGWQAGTDDNGIQAYDFVAAFEINPDYAAL